MLKWAQNPFSCDVTNTNVQCAKYIRNLMVIHRIKRDPFYLLDYVTADLKNCDFKKKKKKKKDFPDTTSKLFVFGIIRNHPESNYFKTSVSFSKLGKIYDKWDPYFFYLRLPI